jgi:pyruvate-formate lyase-activating enzyme
LGCAWVETYLGLHPEGDAIVMQCCARNTIDEVLVRTPYMNNFPDFSVELLNKFLLLKNKIADNLKFGIVHENCANCPYIKETYYFKHRKIRQIALTAVNACNFKCIYCSQKQFEPYKYSAFEDTFKALMKLEANGILAADAFVALSMGEFSAQDKGNKLANYVSGYDSVLFTNAYKWSETAASALEKGKSYLYASVDAGTRETYKTVKGRDVFDQVCDNLRKYAAKGAVVLKYIICEGYNDNNTDIQGFFELADNVAYLVVLSRDYYQKGTLSDVTLRLCDKFSRHFEESNKMGSLIGLVHGDEQMRLNEILNNY